MLVGKGTQRGRSLHLDLEIQVTVQAHTVDSDLCGDITNPVLVFCYDFEVVWTFCQQLERTAFQVL